MNRGKMFFELMKLLINKLCVPLPLQSIWLFQLTILTIIRTRVQLRTRKCLASVDSQSSLACRAPVLVRSVMLRLLSTLLWPQQSKSFQAHSMPATVQRSNKGKEIRGTTASKVLTKLSL